MRLIRVRLILSILKTFIINIRCNARVDVNSFTNKTQTKSHSSLKLYTHFHRPNTLSVTPPTRQKAGGQRPVEPFATTVVIGGVWTVERRCDYGGGVLFLRQKTAAVVVDCWWFECCCGAKGNRRC
uniref:Secreted protein n=1 Tax=Helianthus annuus TaxID=4232 RepID=A0A251VF82_HELAN